MSRLIAALPMYDWPERRAEVDAEWADIRDRLRARGFDAPERLTRRNGDLPPVPGGIRDAEGRVVAPDPATLPPDELDMATLWRHPALLFSQTCWGPLEATDLAAHVRVIVQPDYSAFEGGEGENYRSAIVVRRGNLPPSGLPAISPSRGEIGNPHPIASIPNGGEGRNGRTDPISPLEGEMAGRPKGGRFPDPSGLRGLRFAFNDAHSMSGYLGLARDLVAAGEIADVGAMADFWSATIPTGGHRASVVAVAEGLADIAAIDCRSWTYARRHEPAAAALAVVGWTAPRKGLPFITSRFSALASL